MNTEQNVSRSGGATAIMWVTAVIGGVALLGTGATAAVAASGDVFNTNSGQAIDVSGVTGIDVEANAADLRIEFADVSEARLDVTNGSRGAWRLDRDDDELIVRSPDNGFGWLFGGGFGDWFDDDQRVVLTLPSSLQGSDFDASLTLNAGRLDVEGEFGELDATVSAGAMSIGGSARSLDAEVNAGRADITLDGVDEAELSMSAGNLTVELTGTAPESTSVDASAGSVTVTVPDVEYRVLQDISAGTLNSKVRESSSADRLIEVSLSAGTVTLRPAS